MKIAFALPGRSQRPAGGYKVVYEYANRLAVRGHSVSVVHPWGKDPPASLRARVEARLWLEWLRRRRDAVAPWFEVDRRVDLALVPCRQPDLLPEADATIATAWQTAEWVAAAVAGRGGGFHLVQGHETWEGRREVADTWHLPLHKIVISRWLEELAAEMGEGSRTSRVPNGLDLNRYGVDVPPGERRARVGAIAGRAKGTDDVAAALSIARASVPDLEATIFGTGSRPVALPEWVEYTRLPSQVDLRRLYNSCAVFLQASRSEGWGLPATEAMACGCALATYDNGGSREYAIDGSTALVAPRQEPEELAAVLVRLLRDRALRLSLADRGREHVAAFTWDRSVTAMEGVLESVLAEKRARV